VSPARYPIRISIGERPLVSIDDFALRPECVTFLFGESGIGKSLLSQALYGLIDPEELSVQMDGRPYEKHVARPWTREVRRSSFFVFQEPSSHLNPLMTISDQLAEGSLGESHAEEEILSHFWKGASREKLAPVIDIYPKPYRPSGGEKQRVLLVMAFKKIDLLSSAERTSPTFFVFDEPTGSLDNSYRDLFLELLFRKFSERPFTALVITHDYSIISEVYRAYREHLERIRFQELSRRPGGSVELRDFAPDEYLSWLREASMAAPPRARRESKTVLDMALDHSKRRDGLP
jgi:ABC-type glutathione transport system ATPase component